MSDSLVTTRFGSGGQQLTPGGAGAPSLATVLRRLIDQGNVLGLIGGAPTTPSSQASGTGAIDWNVDFDKGEVRIGDYSASFAAAADYDVYHAAGQLVAASESVYARIVAKLVTTTVSLVVVVGTQAATGEEEIPTDAEVQAALGAGVEWVDVCLCHLARNSTTGLTQTEQSTYRNHVQKG